MTTTTIEKLQDLLHFGKDKSIIDYKITNLTAPGENYGSLMLKLDVTVKTGDGTKVLCLVAKMVPPNEFIQKIFNTQVTYRNEVGYYKQIIPVLQEFQREHGVKEVIDISPKYYGSRLNLQEDDTAKVDSNAVLLLENLKVDNYITFERTTGFDADLAKLVLEDLAYLHAVSLAVKLQKPEVFEKAIKPYLFPWKMPEEGLDDNVTNLNILIDAVDELQPYRERILEGFKRIGETRSPREPFATVAHNDCWVNNIMVKAEHGKPLKVKLVDFQLCDYGSPAKDVLFFLFSSVKTKVLQESYDDLIKYYFAVFKGVLETLKCNLVPFSLEAFQKEMDCEAKYSQFGHIAFMLYPIFLPKDKVREVGEFNRENLLKHANVSELHKEKFTYIVKEFVKRNWI